MAALPQAAPAAGEAIACESLVKIYTLNGVEVQALQGLDLAVTPGETLGLVGASGSGKSTLLNVLGGLDRPTAGRVWVGGRDLLKLSDAELDRYRREQVGFVWQQPSRNLLPYLTAGENVELPLRLSGWPAARRVERVGELLDLLGLAAKASRLPAQLSGGEQQRAAIAVALANHPGLLLADEPTGELDTHTALEVYAALRRASERGGLTVVIVSHDPNLHHHADRVMAIRDGKTSTETVRSGGRAASGAPEVTAGPAPVQPVPAGPVSFEELVVLDAAGRLQIPGEYLEALNIGGRARVELKDGSLRVHPVAGYGRAPAAAAPGLDEPLTEADEAPLETGRGWTGRARRAAEWARRAFSGQRWRPPEG